MTGVLPRRILSYLRTVQSTAEGSTRAAEGEGMRSAHTQSKCVDRLTSLTTVFVFLSLIVPISHLAINILLGDPDYLQLRYR